MSVKQTDSEKKAKGTLQKCRVVAPRGLADVQQDIGDTVEAIEMVRYNLNLAMTEIKARGMFISATVTNSNGQHTVTQKLNPAFKIHRESVGALKSLTRHLSILREEEDKASAKKVDDDEWAELET
jgi:hypothetical protein